MVPLGPIDNVLCTLMLCLHAHRTKIKTGENIITIHRENIASLGLKIMKLGWDIYNSRHITMILSKFKNQIPRKEKII